MVSLPLASMHPGSYRGLYLDDVIAVTKRRFAGYSDCSPTSGNIQLAQDCVVGHVRFELRNVVANYPFERSRGFPGSEPNSGQGDHSRLSCSGGGLGSAGIFSKRSARTLAIMRRRREGTNWPRSLSIRRWSGGGKASNTIAQFALDFPRKESVCGDHGRWKGRVRAAAEGANHVAIDSVG